MVRIKILNDKVGGGDDSKDDDDDQLSSRSSAHSVSQSRCC